MILKLSNKENTYTFTVDDLNNGEKLYYKFQIPASDVVDGKYNMVLMDDDGNVITEEQVCMGNFNAETIQYNRGENVYINSPLNANLEDVRTITIDVPNYTIYPSEGYDAMKEVVVDAQPVYDNGYNEGETTQKAKLTGITITENGTYSREDGYNEITVDVPDLNGDYNEGYDAGKVDGYDSGYTAGIDYASENAGEIAAANAINLVATDFGTYYTKYSDNIVNPNPVTGIYPDGEKFYDLVETNKVFDTGIFANETTKLEFWAEFLNTNNNSSFSILSNSEGLYLAGGGWGFAKATASYERCDACLGGAGTIEFNLKFNKLYHIELSFSDGLIVDGEQLGTFSRYGNKNQTLLLNGWINQSFENVYNRFGMIKITTDGITNVIIPTENGFLNTTTNQLLEVVKDFDTYEYINNDPTILPNLIKSVNVQSKIDVAKYDIKLGNSTFKEVPDFYDFSNITDMSNMFNNCGYLQTIPELNTSNATNMSYMFNGCGSLQTIPELNTSNATDMTYMFNGCSSLTTIPELNTSNVTNMKYMFAECKSLQTIPELDTRKVANMEYMFYSFNGIQTLVSLPKIYCDSCTTLHKFFTYGNTYLINNLTDVGGWINLKCSWNGYGINCVPNLTYQSCINILNGLYDFTDNGETPASNQGQLKVHPNFLTAVGDEISIGINKGWTITA